MCVSLSGVNGHTYGFEFSGCTSSGWLSRSSSKVKVTRSKMFLMGISRNFQWDICLRKDMGLCMAKEVMKEYDCEVYGAGCTEKKDG